MKQAEWTEFDWLIGASFFHAKAHAKAIPWLRAASLEHRQYYGKWAAVRYAICLAHENQKEEYWKWVNSAPYGQSV